MKYQMPKTPICASSPKPHGRRRALRPLHAAKRLRYRVGRAEWGMGGLCVGPGPPYPGGTDPISRRWGGLLSPVPFGKGGSDGFFHLVLLVRLGGFGFSVAVLLLALSLLPLFVCVGDRGTGGFFLGFLVSILAEHKGGKGKEGHEVTRAAGKGELELTIEILGEVSKGRARV